MVYCGKPSKGCAPCRSKRTKCDLKLPVCSQCVRTGRVCSGYRNIEATEFRDQSNDVTMRVKNTTPTTSKFLFASSKTPPEAFPSPDFVNPGQLSKLSPSDSSDLSIPQSFFPFPEDGAVTFFFNDYVVENGPAPRNVYDALPRLYSAASADSALANIVAALGLACLASTMQVPDIMMRANVKYAQALRSINSALRNPVQAKADETLLVVTLLGLYEEHNTTSKSIDPWTNHVKGALALLDYRGQEQLSNHIGLQLIRSLRTQVVVNCLIRRVDVPETILKWSRLAREHESSHDVAESELADTLAKFCSLQAAIDAASLDESYDPSFFVSSALTIDVDLADWAARWQNSSQYATMVVQEPTPEVFSDHWHLYPDILVATIWNHYRCIRIMANQIIITQLAHMTANLDQDLVVQYSSVYNEQIDSSKRSIIDLSHKICCSVPYFLNRYPGHTGDNWNSTHCASKNARAKLILWPLYVAGQTELVSDMMRLWVVEQLEELSEDMGTHKSKAKALANLLRNKQKASGKAWRDAGISEYDEIFGGDDTYSTYEII